MKLTIACLVLLLLAGCAGLTQTPAEQVGEMMEEADAQIATARSSGIPTETCLRIDGIIDLSGNPFITANAKVLLVKRSQGADIEC